MYSISLADWKATGVVIRAYDNMSLLDVPYFISDAEGTLYDFLTLAATACGITLAQTRAQFELLPNADVTYSFNSSTGVETWRDIVSCIAQIVGGFATCNRAGELLFVPYGQTECDTLDTTQRHTGGNFSDYTTKYTSFSVTFVETKETRTYSQPTNDGLVMQLGANPFLQDEDTVNTIAQDLLDAIANIQYTPCKISVASNPVYDLGDVIEFTDGLAGTSSLCCVQKYEFYMHKNLKLSCFGADPNSADAKSKTQKQIVSLQQGIAQTSEQTLDFIFPSTLSQSDIADNTSNTVETFDFNAAIEDGKVDFFTCVQFTAGTTVASNVYSDLVLTVTLTLDGTTIATILQAYRDGQQVLTITHLIEDVTQGNHTLTVTFACAGGSLTSLQFIAAYLLTAKSTNGGTQTSTALFANGDFASGVLPDGLDKNLLTKEANISGAEYNAVKYLRSETVQTPQPNVSGLSEWYLSKYALCVMMYYGTLPYTYRGAIMNQSVHDGGCDVSFYLPIKRITGYNKLVYESKNTYTGQYNYHGMGVCAIVDGVMRIASASWQSGITDWTTFTVDISTVPYVDYLMFNTAVGNPQFRNIRLVKDN